jgi:hypothetical protein
MGGLEWSYCSIFIYIILYYIILYYRGRIEYPNIRNYYRILGGKFGIRVAFCTIRKNAEYRIPNIALEEEEEEEVEEEDTHIPY